MQFVLGFGFWVVSCEGRRKGLGIGVSRWRKEGIVRIDGAFGRG